MLRQVVEVDLVKVVEGSFFEQRARGEPDISDCRMCFMTGPTIRPSRFCESATRRGNRHRYC